MKHSVCFIGHRKINDTPELRERLKQELINLLANGTVNFLFGDHSMFNELCYETVTELKKEYPQIKRVHFRKDYEEADEYTLSFLRSGYEESVCPKGVGRSGRAAYVERNMAMIRESDICVFYYDESVSPQGRKQSRRNLTESKPKSGTAIAYGYAKKKEKVILNLFF